MATYPSTLPIPQSDGYQDNPVDQTVRTDMEIGTARVRRRTTARNDRLNVTYLFTDAQLTTFRTWFFNAAEANGGASWFNASLAIGTGTLQTLEARFVGPYKSTNNGGLLWTVTAELEVR